MSKLLVRVVLEVVDTQNGEKKRERRAGKIAADEVVEVDGKVSRGTQTYESNFTQKEKPLAVVKPNSHLRDAIAWRQQQ